MVDSADEEKLGAAKTELHELLERPELGACVDDSHPTHAASIPLLVLANKNDLPQSLMVNEIIKRLFVGRLCSRLTRTQGVAKAHEPRMQRIQHLGSNEQQITCGTMAQLAQHDFGAPLHSLILVGKRVHFLEAEMST